MKIGDKVQFKSLNGLPNNVRKLVDKDKLYTIRKIKDTGGILLENVFIGINYFGNEQGFLPHRFKKK